MEQQTALTKYVHCTHTALACTVKTMARRITVLFVTCILCTHTHTSKFPIYWSGNKVLISEIILKVTQGHAHCNIPCITCYPQSTAIMSLCCHLFSIHDTLGQCFNSATTIKTNSPPLEYDFVLFSKQVVGNNIPEHNEPMKY